MTDREAATLMRTFRGYPKRRYPGQSGRTVLVITSGMQITARHIGLRSANDFVGAMTEYHMRRHRVREEHYAVYTFRSRSEMRREMVRRFGAPTSWRMFDLEWLR